MSGVNGPNYGRVGSNQFKKASELGLPIPKVSKKTREKIGKNTRGIKWSKERKKTHSAIMMEAVRNNPESYSTSNVSGRVKTIEYKGFKLKGKWELAVAKWLDKNNYEWTNILDPFEYEWNSKTHLYFPDFYLPIYDYYIEVKGYQRERDTAKWKVVDRLLIIKKNEIEKIKLDSYKLELN